MTKGQVFPVEKPRQSYATEPFQWSICHMHPIDVVWDWTASVKWRLCGVLLFSFSVAGNVNGQGGLAQEEVRARAEASYQAGAFLEAMADFERLVSLFPEEACLHGRLAGCALSEPGRLALVRRHLRIALRKGCDDLDLGYHQARLAQLEYDFDRAGDLYAAYLAKGGKKARFKAEAEEAAQACRAVEWDPSEAVALEVYERIPADPEASFRYYNPDVEGLRLVATPPSLRSKADEKSTPGRLAVHDGDTVLVFASLGKKGSRGSDLYRVSIRMGEYTDPVPLGAAVNSEYDEKDAYLSKEGTLYFSSNRPGGLGGFDIYAVNCGLDGFPTAQPHRLPYPINSVNDDVFFIPEADGGAWMASNRAAVAGKVHAYRIGLGAGSMATGSVAWSADEVASEGLTLRVFSNGEEMAAESLDGDAPSHVAFAGEAAVRIVLEDADGRVISESFGNGEGAWELKRGSDGWVLEGKTDVAADWALLSDVQVGPAPVSSSLADGAAGESASSSESSGVSETAGWTSWLNARFEGEPADASGEDVVSEAVSDVSDVGETVDREDAAAGSALQGAEDTLGAGDPEAEDVDPSVEAAAAALWLRGDAEEIAERVPDDPEVVERLLEERPEVLVEVWETRAERVLFLERDFLDDPDVTKAGALFDLIDEMESWTPNGEMMDARLRDGIATNDIRDMLDEWTRAVQSATKASLAKVAGEAALAYRRDRLAVRELWGVSGADLTGLKRRWSEWRDADRGIPGANPDAAEMPRLEGDALMADWNQVLSSAPAVWSRRDRSGWRGAWLTREADLLARSQDIWVEQRPEGDDADLAVSEAADAAGEDAPEMDLADVDAERPEVSVDEGVDVAAAQDEQEEQRAQDEQEDARDSAMADPEGAADGVQDLLLTPGAGEADVTMVMALFPEQIESSDEGGERPPTTDDWKEEWGAAVGQSKEVDRAWERLAKVLDGQGLAPVENGAEWMALDKRVRSAYSAVAEAVLEELDQLQGEWRLEREPLVSGWQALDLANPPMEFEEDIAALALEMDQIRLLEQGVADEQSKQEGATGAARYDALLARRSAMERAEGAWRAWAERWEAIQFDVEAAVALAAEESTEEPDLDTEDADLAVEPAPEANIEEEVPVEGALEEGAAGDASASEPVVPSAPVSDMADADPVETAAVDAAEQIADAAEDVAVGDVPTASPAPENAQSALSEVLPDWSDSDLEQLTELMTLLGARAQQAGSAWAAQEQEALAAWTEFHQMENSRPLPGAGRAARLAWDKRNFFASKDLKSAMAALDVDQLASKLTSGEVVEIADAEEVEPAEPEVAEPEVAGGTDVATTPPVEAEDVASLPSPEEEAIVPPSEPAAVDAGAARQNEAVAAYGIILPEAQVVGQSGAGSGRGNGLTLRPIEREAMERAILGNAVTSGESAAAVFAADLGAPMEVGVEYKVQVGAFRKALPAALFAAFDPMWANALPNGITRYMAGSFDAYDRAVEARNAIRELGYEDAFVVRFVDGVRVRASRPAPELLAAERQEQGRINVRPDESPAGVGGAGVAANGLEGNGAAEVPTRREDIPTWDLVQGRVFSVQVGAFRGVPDASALTSLGTLTREDAGTDGWLRLFSGRFGTLDEALLHKAELLELGRSDAFIVVYINGRRTPISQASTTSVAPITGMENGAEADIVMDPVEAQPVQGQGWYVELGVFSSTIPVKLANAILDAPLGWAIRSLRADGLTRYRTRNAGEAEARRWLAEAQSSGFRNARLVSN